MMRLVEGTRETATASCKIWVCGFGMVAGQQVHRRAFFADRLWRAMMACRCGWPISKNPQDLHPASSSSLACPSRHTCAGKLVKR